MDQRITIKIGGINYTLKVPSPEKEELMRTAAELVNRKLETLTANLPDKSDLDKMSMIALNVAVSALVAQRQAESVKAEIDKLLKDTDNYLESIK
ncbi:MAG: cell division protein ZapA [Bacteroidales bacterium]|jgi:cell division protein ZapA (FtsZ GTPase activity inhibitor)|nr:cell division protein ZapA [Bacteroidales bacterium]MBQ2550507.1 cell division protein ZapA [Bacteroidales bacterium]MBQ3847082.1 cell division protein ZapA [Bacteroidales bacterium]